MPRLDLLPDSMLQLWFSDNDLDGRGKLEGHTVSLVGIICSIVCFRYAELRD